MIFQTSKCDKIPGFCQILKVDIFEIKKMRPARMLPLNIGPARMVPLNNGLARMLPFKNGPARFLPLQKRPGSIERFLWPVLSDDQNAKRELSKQQQRQRLWFDLPSF
jgi:hypothetical protein